MVGTLLLAFMAFTFIQCIDPAESRQDDPTETSYNDVPAADLIAIDFLDDFTFSEPINYNNLQVFMISGESHTDAEEYVPLGRAMEEDYVKLKETSDVNELKITNHSEETIYINAGDIVKGGKQDRTLAYDMIIEPKSRGVKLSSFCVESGRWEQRGGEDAANFSYSTKSLTSRDLKISSKKDNEQGAVWEGVADQQEKLSYNISSVNDAAVDVKSSESESSLELTLDNEELAEIRRRYLKAFANIKVEEFIGFAYAINGELYNVDLYNNKALFAELFDKLLTAAVVEAIAELDTKQTSFKYITVKDVKASLQMDKNSEETAEDLNKRTRWLSKEDADKVIFTSADKKLESEWVHRNIIIKDKSKPARNNDNYGNEGEAMEQEIQQFYVE